MDSGNRKLAAIATSLERAKNNFRLFIYKQSSTIPANFVKIGQVDVEIIGLKEITERYIKTRAKHIAHLRLLETGWAK